jgi:hypothetical protein
MAGIAFIFTGFAAAVILIVAGVPAFSPLGLLAGASILIGLIRMAVD